jgi:ligand-binding sensor domain-containing protein/signal transduction histidine kinase/DNA-binding response OmpR family regulator
MVLMLLLHGRVEAQSTYFRNYQTIDGLSNNAVTAITQDEQGFLWFGTRNGLNRFDGHQFKVFSHTDSAALRIGSSSILSLLTDSKGTMWVGTTHGLYRYVAEREDFKFVEEVPMEEVRFIKQTAGYIWFISNGRLYRYSLKDQKINVFKQLIDRIIAASTNHNNDLWLVDSRHNILRYNAKADKFSSIDLSSLHPNIRSSIKTVYGINDSLVIIGTAYTAYLLDCTQNKLTDLITKRHPQKAILVHGVIQQSPSVLWIGTEMGIYSYDLSTGAINHIKKDPLNPFSLSDNVVTNFFKDQEGSVWAGTFFGGVNQYTSQFENFKKYLQGNGKFSLSGNVIHEIAKDKYGNFWVGTEDGGLNRILANSNKVQHFKADGKLGSITHNNLHGLAMMDEELWVGSTSHGLDILDLKTGLLKRHYRGIGEGLTRSKFVVCLYKTRDDNMFVGTDKGLYSYDKKKREFKLVPIPLAWIQGIYEDAEGILWINTYGSGVIVYDRTTGINRQLLSQPGKANTLVNNYVNGLFEDSKKNIWLATEAGLSKYRRNGEFTTYLHQLGLPSTQVFKVLEDDNHAIWVSTGSGLVKLEENSPEETIFTARDGLPTDQFNYNSAFKDSDGTLYFGTIKGMVSFNPAKTIKNNFVPPVFISNLQINNKDVAIGKDGFLQRSISLSKELRLTYDHSNINFNIAALSFASPESNVYSYIMEGYDKEWTTITGSQKIYYNKLPPGTYTFRYTGANNSKLWNQAEKTLRIIVSPPWWRSLWAYTFYLFILGTVVFLILRYYFLWVQASNVRKMDSYEREKEREIYNLKLESFTNLAHEIRTPLTLIKMPLEKIMSGNKIVDEDIQQDLALIEKNTLRLIILTNQLLDFRKAENNNMSLIFTKTEINALLDEVFNDLQPLAKEKKLTYELLLPRITLTAYVDSEALRKIFTNLIHNAIKYAYGKVEIKLLPFNSDDIMFNVEFGNDGPIIPFDKKDKIFEPFYRLHDADKNTGTGIGLPLSRSLAELHHGSLSLVYTKGERNLFLLSCPILQDEPNNKQFTSNPPVAPYEQQGIATGENPETETPIILVVEDNKEILAYLNKELKGDYAILRAGNGAEAMEIIEANNVQLVLTDIMMPIMDGVALCKRIKSDILYSHIPVIFLTAKNGLDAKIEGLKSGADAYIEKPFSLEYLLVNIRNMLNNRKIIKDYFTAPSTSNVLDMHISGPDKDFIDQLHRVIYEQIDSTELNVEVLAKSMNMSRPTLYRKIKGLSDLSPNELINISRLRKAAELLLLKKHSIAQIATMVGYSVQSNFSRDFHKHYSMTPSLYITAHSDKTSPTDSTSV